jgi:cardiolipin-specific phospholipase
MLGWGLSSRPTYDLLTSENDVDVEQHSGSNNGMGGKLSMKTKQKVYSAESFFVESLESWRRHHNLSKMTLAGHSMGGYLSVAYAERYPQHVERLILLSPVGVPELQPDADAKLSSYPLHIRAMFKTVRYFFNRGITPGYFLRSLPYSKSKAMVEGYIARRLPAITCPEEQEHLGEYLYQNTMLPGSGEDCLTDILHANAFAKMPLEHRIPALRSDMEVHMVYGQHDWMDWRGGIETQRTCHKQREEWERGRTSAVVDGSGPPPRVFVHGVKDAGHLLMLDNYQEFNAALITAAGGKEGLPTGTPSPAQFVCDEVARSTAPSRSVRDAGGEEAAAAFFRGR